MKPRRRPAGKCENNMSEKSAMRALHSFGFDVLLAWDSAKARRTFSRRVEARKDLLSAIYLPDARARAWYEHTIEEKAKAGGACFNSVHAVKNDSPVFVLRRGGESNFVDIVAAPERLQTDTMVQSAVSQMDKALSRVDMPLRLEYDGQTVDTKFVIAKISFEALRTRTLSLQMEVYTKTVCDELDRQLLGILRRLEQTGQLRLPTRCARCGCDRRVYDHAIQFDPEQFRVLVQLTVDCYACRGAPGDSSCLVVATPPGRVDALIEVERVTGRHPLPLRADAMRCCSRMEAAVDRLLALHRDKPGAVTVLMVQQVAARLSLIGQTHLHTQRTARRIARRLLEAVEPGELATLRETLRDESDTGRLCQACRERLDSNAFSKTQWRKGASRRCLVCCARDMEGTVEESQPSEAQCDPDDECHVCMCETARAERRALHGDGLHWVCGSCLHALRLHGVTNCPLCRAVLSMDRLQL